jgi:hypothetical protein
VKRTLELFRGITMRNKCGKRSPIVESLTLRARRAGVLWGVEARLHGDVFPVSRPTVERALQDAARLMRVDRWRTSRRDAAIEARSLADAEHGSRDR